MSECKLDHSMEDVLAKLNSQKAVLPAALYAETEDYVKGDRSQELLSQRPATKIAGLPLKKVSAYASHKLFRLIPDQQCERDALSCLFVPEYKGG